MNSKQDMSAQKNSYQCTVCRQIFTRGWTDKEAMEESKSIFGDIPKEQLCIVCDDCFKQIDERFGLTKGKH